MSNVSTGGEQTAEASQHISEAMVELTEVGEALMTLVLGKRDIK